MINHPYSILSIFNTVLSVAGIAGGIWAWRQGFAKTANEVQERVINALETDINNLREKIDETKRENLRLDQIILTLCEALKKRGMIITIEGTLVTISDGKDTHSVRIQGA